jgi:type I restriction enzyme M protein
MRGAMDAGEYKHVALSLLFMRYVSVAFERNRVELEAEEYADPDDPEEYLAESTFFVPEKARWSCIAARSKADTISTDVLRPARRGAADCGRGRHVELSDRT